MRYSLGLFEANHQWIHWHLEIGTEISFEWYTFDFKLKSIFLEFSKYEDGRGIAYLN